MNLDALSDTLEQLSNRLKRSIVSDGYFERTFCSILHSAAEIGLNVSFDVKDKEGNQVAGYSALPFQLEAKIDIRNFDNRAIETEVRVQKTKISQDENIDFEDILRKLFSAVEAHWGYREARSMLPSASDQSVGQKLIQSLHEQVQEARWFAVLHSDLDKFKNINSEFGYEIGNKAIREFSDRMRRELAGTSIVVRMGGDEMAAFIFSDDPNLFFDRAESLRRTMENEPLVAISRANTCSIGLAIFETSDLPADLVSVERLVGLATPQEVVAKTGGRNRISLPSATLPSSQILDVQEVLDDLCYCALISRRNLQAEALRLQGLPVVDAVARLLNDRLQAVEIETTAIESAIATVRENMNIEVVSLSALGHEGRFLDAADDGWPAPLHPQIPTPLWGALLARALLCATLRSQGPLDPADDLAFRLASTGKENGATAGLYLDVRRKSGTDISVFVGSASCVTSTEHVVQIGRPWYPAEADQETCLRRLIIDENAAGAVGYEPLSPCLVMPIGDDAIDILKVLSRCVAGVVEVDDRPVKGGGLPDFWQSNLGRIVRAALRNPNVCQIVAVGEESGAAETIKRLKLSRANWTAKSYDLQRRLSISGDSLKAFRERDIKLEMVPNNRTKLLQTLARLTADQGLQVAVDLKPINLDLERSKRRLLNAAPTNSNQLLLIDGLRCKSLADAYPRAIQLLRSSSEPPQVEPSGRSFREFPCFKLALTEPFQDTIPDYWESEAASIELYFEQHFESSSGLFGSQLATPRPGDDSLRDGCVRAVASAIQERRPTRRIVLPVATLDQPVGQPLGLSTIQVMPRQRNDQWHLDFQWIWRTVEALVGFPFSAIGSIRWSQKFFDSVKAKLAAEGDAHRVELGQLTYMALSFHMFLDVGDLEIARAIEQDATR